MEKNFFLAITLSFVVLVAFNAYKAKTAPPKPPAPEAPGAEPEPGQTPQPGAEAAAPKPEGGAAALAPAPSLSEAPAPEAPAAGPEEPPAVAREVVLENDVLKLVLHSEGASIRRVVLKRYFDYRARRSALEEEPVLDLLEAFVMPSAALSFELAPKPVGLRDAVWHVAEATSRKVIFRRRSGALVIEKEIALAEGTGYHADVKLRLRNDGKEAEFTGYALTVATAIRQEQAKVRFPSAGIAGVRKGDEVEFTHESADKLPAPGDDEPKEFEGNTTFGGVASEYFAMALLPVGDLDRFTLSLTKVDGKTAQMPVHEAHSAMARYRAKPVRVGPGETVEDSFRFFAGPKKEEVVAAYAAEGLTKVVDLSSRVPLAESLSHIFLFLLHHLGRLLGSIGVGILLLTLLVRGLLHPLSVKSQRSMYKMQKLAPKVKEIQARYEGKKSTESMQKMQKEIGELYKKHGVSPLAGCLPMFLQLPVFIGLYNVLAYSIELRQTPFLWISDLSKPDRTMALGFQLPLLGESYLNVLPILMAVVMWIQQSLAPTPSDPQQAQQQKVMKLFMLVMPLFFYALPSGLVLYFLVSSLVGLLETRYIKHQLKREEEPGPIVA